jgi:type I restriction enzyme M protein
VRQLVLSSFLDLHHAVQDQGLHEAIFRGVSDASFGLVPKVGRLSNYSPALERDMLLLFKQHGCAFLERDPPNDWDWLAISQHHGLPTRLLDWTYSPLVAAYFAVEERSHHDGAIYAMDATMVLDTKAHRNPLARSSGIDVFQPDHRTQRIAAQSGIFTIHWAPRVAIPRRKLLMKLTIPASLKTEFKDSLYKYGVHAGALFPDLDGQARFLSWLFSRD